MAAINSRIVRRSHALLGFPWGEDFRYSEVSAFPNNFKGKMNARKLAGMLGAFLLLASRPGLRPLLLSFLPSPGEGPNREEQEKGYCRILFRGQTDQGDELTARVHISCDPGYSGTAIMLAESALCLVQDEDKLTDNFGVLTPASAMGVHLIRRLCSAGIIFSVDDVPQYT